MNSPDSSIESPFSLKLFLPLLASIVAITPFAVDTYLPAMTVIAKDLNTDMSMMQLTLSLFLAGYAAGLMFFGPLADIFGRRPIVLLGLTGFALSTGALAFCESVTSFLLLRFIQAFIGAAATVPISGYIRAIYGKNMAKGMSYVSMIMMVAPMVAPTVGILLMELHGWELIFITLGSYAALILALATFSLPKVATKPRTDTLFNTFFKSYAIVLSEKKVRRYIFIVGLATMSFFGYLTAIPFIYMEVFGVSEKMFGLLFAINVAAFLLASFINTRIVSRYGSLNMLKGALSLSVITAILLLIVNLLGWHLYWTVAFLAIFLAGIVVLSANNDALILIEFAEQTGTATGVIGTLRFGCGALSGPILALMYDGTAVPFCYLLLFAVVTSSACLVFMKNHSGGETA
ncbi:MAG: Bcr/CflA family efflux MFS transporter [Algicola sp.]|nr:Bcr/CflA family efflux MFS transporter [Algicola sp.]